MAKKKASLAKRPATGIVESAKAALVTFNEPEARASDYSGIEDPWGDKGDEAPSGLAPTAQWEHPGEYVDGEYLGFSPSTDKAPSKLYHLKHKTQYVGVWGSSILDDRMDKLNPPKGSMILIQYLGDVETGRKMTPAKNFRVKLLR